MKRPILTRATLLAVVGFVAVAMLAQAASGEKARGKDRDSANESIVIDPRPRPPMPPRPPRPPDYGFDVDIWTDKRVYEVGDLVRINFRVTRPCYVYIFNTDTRGRTHQLFPSYYDRDNHMVPGRTYYIPDRSYRLRVTGPPGTEYLRIVAVRYRALRYERRHPFSGREPFPLYPDGAKGFLQEYESERPSKSKGGGRELDEDEPKYRSGPPSKRKMAIDDEGPDTIVVEPEPRTIVVEPDYYDREYAEASTSIRVVDPYYREEPVYAGKLEVTSRPSGARVTVDGVLRGYTPLTIRHLTPGYHDVHVSKPGYVSWSRDIEILEGRTVRISVRLRLREPRVFFDFGWR